VIYAIVWLIAGLAALIATGAMGDAIFAPHPDGFSFRVVSGYLASVVLFVVAGVAYYLDKKNS